MPPSAELLSREPAAPIMREVDPVELLEQSRAELQQRDLVAANLGPVAVSTELTQEEKDATLREAQAELFADTEPKLYLTVAEKMLTSINRPDISSQVAKWQGEEHIQHSIETKHQNEIANNENAVKLELIYGYASITEFEKARELLDSLVTIEPANNEPDLPPNTRALGLEIIAKAGGFETMEASIKDELNQMGVADEGFKQYENWVSDRRNSMQAAGNGRFVPERAVNRFVQLGAPEVKRVVGIAEEDGGPRTILNVTRALTEFSIGRQTQLLHEMQSRVPQPAN